jgi:hypothetical protein
MERKHRIFGLRKVLGKHEAANSVHSITKKNPPKNKTKQQRNWQEGSAGNDG